MPIPRNGYPFVCISTARHTSKVTTNKFLPDRALPRDTGVGDALPGDTRHRESIFLHVRETASSSHRQDHRTGRRERRESRAAKPAQARNFLAAMRGLWRWAKQAQHVRIDPMANVRHRSRPRAAASSASTEEHVAASERRRPSERASGSGWRSCSTRACAERRAAVRAPARLKEGVGTKTEKSGFIVEVTLPSRGDVADSAGPGRDAHRRARVGI